MYVPVDAGKLSVKYNVQRLGLKKRTISQAF